MGSMGNMAGVFVILAGALLAVIGLRGTHTAVFKNLFQNTASTSNSTTGTGNLPTIQPKPALPGVVV